MYYKWKKPTKNTIKWAANLIKESIHSFSNAPCLIYNKTRSLQNKNSIFLICYNISPIGFAMLRKENNKLYLYELHINKLDRRKGIGSNLIKKCIEYFNEIKYKQFILFVHKENIIAIEFYKKHGFMIDINIPCSLTYLPFTINLK